MPALHRVLDFLLDIEFRRVTIVQFVSDALARLEE